MGGGIVRDSLTILTAKPGAGKSTLLLQVANDVASQGLNVFCCPLISPDQITFTTTINDSMIGILYPIKLSLQMSKIKATNFLQLIAFSLVIYIEHKLFLQYSIP